MTVIEPSKTSLNQLQVSFTNKDKESVGATVQLGQKSIRVGNCELELLRCISMLELIKSNSEAVFAACNDFLSTETVKGIGSNEAFLETHNKP